MGGTSWSTAAYKTRDSYRKSMGKSSFTYSDDILSSISRDKWKVHDNLSVVNKIRESRDSDAHPKSTAVGVVFDVTGSMLSIPRVLQKKLPQLLTHLIKRNYISDPQILFGAIGDAYCDAVPVQFGQFESGNEMEDDMEKIALEGGGGGGRQESYELAMYFFARKTSIDCMEKRGEKGYLFTIGDELPYVTIKAEHIKEYFGDTYQSDIPLSVILEELKEKYHYFHIVPTSSSWGLKNSDKWKEYLGQNLLILDNPDLVCETIISTIGINEGLIDVEDIAEEINLHDADANSVSRAVSTVAGTTVSSVPFPDIEDNLPDFIVGKY